MIARAVIVLLLALGGVALPAEQQSPIFKASAAGVRVHVSVADGRRAVTGLTADHFSVRDNGMTQTIDLVETVERLSVAIVLDQSESTGTGPFGELRAVALDALAALLPSESAALLLFSDRLNVRASLTPDHAAIRTLITQATSHPRTLTALWDAAVAASAFVATAPGRPVLIVVTDGCNNASWLSATTAIQWLAQSGVTVDFMGYGNSLSRRPNGTPGNWNDGDHCYGPDLLDKAAEATGGQVLQTDRRDLSRRIRERVANLRSGYLLTYTPTSPPGKDGWHKIEVTLKGARGRVTARPGYFAGGTSK